MIWSQFDHICEVKYMIWSETDHCPPVILSTTAYTLYDVATAGHTANTHVVVLGKDTK